MQYEPKLPRLVEQLSETQQFIEEVSHRYINEYGTVALAEFQQAAFWILRGGLLIQRSARRSGFSIR